MEKEKKFLSKGNVMLFLIAVAVTMLTAVACVWLGADRTTAVMAGPMAGILAVLGIGALYDITKQQAPMGPEPGILGVVIGTIVSLMVF